MKQTLWKHPQPSHTLQMLKLAVPMTRWEINFFFLPPPIFSSGVIPGGAQDYLLALTSGSAHMGCLTLLPESEANTVNALDYTIIRVPKRLTSMLRKMMLFYSRFPVQTGKHLKGHDRNLLSLAQENYF